MNDTDYEYTLKEFADAVSWEGVEGLLQLGLKSTNIEVGPAREAWEELESLWNKMEPLIHKLWGILEGVSDGPW